MTMGVTKRTGVVGSTSTVERAEPLTVLQAASVKWAMVQYSDESGRVHSTLAVVVGGKVYHAPNGEAWFNDFRSFQSKMSDQIVSTLNAQEAPTENVPKTDAVDVTGGT